MCKLNEQLVEKYFHSLSLILHAYRQTSNISRTVVSIITAYSDVVGASAAGAAPTTSSFST